MRHLTLLAALLLARLRAAPLTGEWIAEITPEIGETQYVRVNFKTEGAKLTGTWSEGKLEGSLAAGALTLKLTTNSGSPMGALTGKANGEEFTGKGTLAVGRRFGGGGDMRNAEPQKIA